MLTLFNLLACHDFDENECWCHACAPLPSCLSQCSGTILLVQEALSDDLAVKGLKEGHDTNTYIAFFL